MTRIPLLLATLLLALPLRAQSVLSLEDCRELALRQSRATQMASLGRDKAGDERRAARSNYLPKIEVLGTYQRTSQSIDLLSDDQKQQLGHLGDGVVADMQAAVAQSNLGQTIQQLAGQILQRSPELAPLFQQGQTAIGQVGQHMGQQLAGSLNGAGQQVVDALDTETRNLGLVTVMFTQPLYMGGKIRAYDRITHYAEELAGERLRQEEQQLILDVDRAYWQVVSLTNKQRLARQYHALLEKLDADVAAMIREGVATRSTALAVGVKLGESEMTLLRIEDGLALSRMLLAQTCGLELDACPQLADEALNALNTDVVTPRTDDDVETAISQRPELRQLDLASQMLRQKVNIERSAFLPTLALTGGYLTTYPSLYNGFETRFRGTWNVGLSLRVPIWSWGEGYYKVRAARTEAAIAGMRRAEATEKIELQVRQGAYAVTEAQRRIDLSARNIAQAEENLRAQRLGFDEGMVSTSDLLAAQTAWVSAESARIDAQIDLRLAQAAYNRYLGL